MSAHHTHHDMSRCREILSQLNEYIDGEIESDLCLELERHLSECADCQVVLDTLTRTVRFYHALHETPIQLNPDIETRLLSRLNL